MFNVTLKFRTCDPGFMEYFGATTSQPREAELARYRLDHPRAKRCFRPAAIGGAPDAPPLSHSGVRRLFSLSLVVGGRSPTTGGERPTQLIACQFAAGRCREQREEAVQVLGPRREGDMERMLKRVGCSAKKQSDKQQQQEAVGVRSGVCAGGNAVGRTRPRINLTDCEDVFRKLLSSNSLMEFTPRAITRRFCGKKSHDNELYRSNSFKFERFDRTDSDDMVIIKKQVSLCDDYSVPVDFVNKRRPLSIGPPPNWDRLSPHSDNVEVLELYCDPRDSKAYLEPGAEATGKLYTTPDKEYTHPYTDYSSESRSGEEDEGEEDGGLYEDVGGEEGGGEEGEAGGSRATPYYYSDLETGPPGGRMSPRTAEEMSRRHLYETAFDSKITKSEEELDVDVVTNKSIIVHEKKKQNVQIPPPKRVSKGQQTGGQRHHHHHHHQHHRATSTESPPVGAGVAVSAGAIATAASAAGPLCEAMSRLELAQQSQQQKDQDKERMRCTAEEEERDRQLVPFRAPTPPSSAPLPTKFHTSRCIATVHSAPDIPVRAKDLKLPIKSSKHRTQAAGTSGGTVGGVPTTDVTCPGRPRSLFCAHPAPRSGVFGEILEIKGRPPARRPKYSSTESMATSSSGGSLESIRSSTSEGNRSTSSCESRRSSSLSSHSSDSTGSGPGGGGTGVGGAGTGGGIGSGGSYHHGLNTRVFQQTQLHILSPISDKSSQEPGSETSENNKNNNSERGSPEETVNSPVGECQKKRRTPQNRNLINLGLCFDQETHQGSDSGISIESRVGKTNTGDLSDLPFDMPKLRRRRMMVREEENSCVQDTSGSATSVDLRDLPFDMPKLRRRLRAAPPPQSNTSSVSQASSSNSFQESTNFGMSRPSLSLDLHESSTRQRIPIGLSLDLSAPPAIESVDPAIPLERQGWYHGAITRLEAESILRVNIEGSYLVRNSESSKQDYSLSLKSARGFMHMRIQQCKESGKYILGQFSNPFTSIPEMIKHYSVNRLPIRGAEHMCLSHPIIEQLL